MPPRPMPSLKILLIWRMVLLVLSDPVLVTSYMCTTTSAMIHSLPPYQTNFESMEMQRLCTSSPIRKWMYKTTLSSFLDFDLKKGNWVLFIYIIIIVYSIPDVRDEENWSCEVMGILRNDYHALAMLSSLLVVRASDIVFNTQPTLSLFQLTASFSCSCYFFRNRRWCLEFECVTSKISKSLRQILFIVINHTKDTKDVHNRPNT